MVMALDQSSTGTPTQLYYPSEVLWRLLEGWSEYEATHRRPRKDFSQGGGISHMVIPTQAAFVGGALDYADLKQKRREIEPYPVQLATSLYWEVGFRSIKQVGKEMRKAEDLIREWVWTGTAEMVVKLCGLPPQVARAECKLYRQYFHNRRVQ